jgi:hypothetical protein
MTELEDLKIQVRRTQAMLWAQQVLILAIFNQLPKCQAILDSFEKDSQTDQDLLLFETEITDQDLSTGTRPVCSYARSFSLQ